MSMHFTNSQGLTIDFNPAAKLEIEICKDRWAEVTADIFRSWGGGRRINGAPYSGPVFCLLTNETTVTIDNLQQA